MLQSIVKGLWSLLTNIDNAILSALKWVGGHLASGVSKAVTAPSATAAPVSVSSSAPVGAAPAPAVQSGS